MEQFSQIRNIQLEDEVFRRASCEKSRIVYAAESGDLVQVQRILKLVELRENKEREFRIRPNLVNWTTSACWSALHMASRFGHLDVVKIRDDFSEKIEFILKICIHYGSFLFNLALT